MADDTPNTRYAVTRIISDLQVALLREAGFAIVPREPTAFMRAAAVEFFAIAEPWNAIDNKISLFKTWLAAAERERAES